MIEIMYSNLKNKDINTASYSENWKGDDSPKSLIGQTSSFRRKILSRIPLHTTKGLSLLSSPAISDDYSFTGDSLITSHKVEEFQYLLFKIGILQTVLFDRLCIVNIIEIILDVLFLTRFCC